MGRGWWIMEPCPLFSSPYSGSNNTIQEPTGAPQDSSEEPTCIPTEANVTIHNIPHRTSNDDHNFLVFPFFFLLYTHVILQL